MATRRPHIRRLSRTYGLPMELDDLKLHLRVEGDEENAYISNLATAAGWLWEARTGQPVMQADYLADWRGTRFGSLLEGLPDNTTAVTRVDHLSAAYGAELVELAADAYTFDVALPWQLRFPAWQTLPALSDSLGYSLQVRFTAGAATPADVPPVVQQFVRLLVGHWYENRQQVVVGVTPGEHLPLGAEALVHIEREIIL